MWVTPDRFELAKYTKTFGRTELTVDRVHDKQGVDVILSDGGQSNGISLEEHELRALLIWYLNWPEASRREPPLTARELSIVELAYNARERGDTLSEAVTAVHRTFALGMESSKAQAKT